MPLTNRLFLLALAGLAGCTAPAPVASHTPAAPPDLPSPAANVPAPDPGPVLPPPEGSLAMIFVAAGDERNVVRNSRGRITEIITPSGRREPVLARILWEEMETLVPLIADIVATNDPERISHIPTFYSQGHIPGPVAWDYLRQFLRPDDALWTFGEADTGMMVTRNNQLFCLVEIKVPFSEN